MDIMAMLGSYFWVIIPIGLFMGLLGYRLYKISLLLVGLFLGLSFGAWLGHHVDNKQLGTILGIVLGVGLGMMSHFLIRFSIFLAGLAGGYVLANVILPYTNIEASGVEALLWSLGAALAGGLITLALHRTLILIITAFLGTYLVYLGSNQLFPAGTEGWSWGLYLALMVLFILVQMGARRGYPDPILRGHNRRRYR